MDPVSVVLFALFGLALMWFVFRAFSNFRHGPSAKVRADMNTFRSEEGYLYDFGSGHYSGPKAEGPPKSGRGHAPHAHRCGLGVNATPRPALVMVS